jgi:hypothetical protein
MSDELIYEYKVRDFIFELSMLLTQPKTPLEKAIIHAMPTAGLDAIDDVGDWLRELWYEFKTTGHIIK